MKFKFTHKNQSYSLEVRECNSIYSKFNGLMFQKYPPALLFNFKKPNNQPIHSYFCKPFIAIWFNNNKIADIKFVEPWKLSIKPKNKFNKLLEIPINNNLFKIILDKIRKV